MIHVFKRISGKAPFRGKNIEEILSENKKGLVNFNIPEFSQPSAESNLILLIICNFY